MTPIDRVSALESLLARIKKNAAEARPVRAATRASAPGKQPVANVRPAAAATLDTTPPPSTLHPAQLRSEPPEEPTLVRQQMAPDLEQLARDAQSDDAVLEVEFDEIEFVDEGTLEAGKTPPPPRAPTRPPGANSKMRVMPSNSPLASMAREAARADAERVSARAATDRASLDRAAAERIAKEQAEVDRRHAEEEREEAERFERELEEAERSKAAEKAAAAAEAARVAREQQDRIEAARIARERAEREERERGEREQAEREAAARRAREQDQRDQAARERAEREQIARANEDAERRSRELADRAREEAERVTREMEEPQHAVTIPGEPNTTMRTPSSPEQSGVKNAAPISSRQPRADDYRAGDDGFGELLDDDQPPESGEVASQRKPTIHDEPTMVAAALAGWEDEGEDEPNRRPTTPQDEPPFADVSHSSRKLPTGEDATMLHSRADLRRPEPPPPAIVNRPSDPRAEVVRRSAPTGEPAAFVGELRATRPTSFGDLLDASLSLGLDDEPSRPTQ